jgi:phosphate starvation-inducible protein PhoH
MELVSFVPVDNPRLANLCGVLDENLRQMETALDVSIARRGEVFQVDGEKARLAVRLLQDFISARVMRWISTRFSWRWWKPPTSRIRSSRKAIFPY